MAEKSKLSKEEKGERGRVKRVELYGTGEQIPNPSRQGTPRRRLKRKTESLDLDVFPTENLIGFGSSLFGERRELKTKLFRDGSDGLGQVFLSSGDVGGELNSVVHQEGDFFGEGVD